MSGLAAQKVLILSSFFAGGVLRSDASETLIFTDPLVLLLIVIAQTRHNTFPRVIGPGQADGEWRVQLSDQIPFQIK